jgi:hypothetical protein
MKDVREVFRYDHSVADVFALVSQGSFQLEIISHLGGKSGEIVEEDTTDAGVRLVTRQQTAIELPGFAKKLIPANTTVTQTYVWSQADGDGNRIGTWAADSKGAPISIGGPTELKADGDGGCTHTYMGQVKASIPLVGGKLESFAMDNLERELAKAHEFTVGRLGT